MTDALSPDALDQLFRNARTYNAFSGEISDETLHQLYGLMKLGPTEANSTPARLVFVKSQAAKAKLGPALSEGNYAKTMAAPVTVIVGYDMRFHDKLPYLFPHADAKSWFEGSPEERMYRVALRSSSLQGAYLIMAARAGPGHRPDVGLRQRQGRCGILRRYRGQVELPGQPGPWRPRQRLPALAAPAVRRSRADRVNHIPVTPFRSNNPALPQGHATMRKTLFVAALLAFAGSAFAAPVSYKLDPNHTNVLASWTHLGFSHPSIGFSQVEGTLVYDADKVSASSVEVTLPINGLSGFSAMFNEHLNSANWFDSAQFPTATFKSTKVEATGKGKLKVTGDLTIHGVTKPAVLNATLNKAGEHPMGKRAAIGFDATATIKRSDFGLGKLVPNVSDEVQIRITTEALVPKPAE